MAARVYSMTLLALPRTAILIMQISRLYLVEASRTDEDPLSVHFNANAVQRVVRLVAA
jgi:hypothetical protein